MYNRHTIVDSFQEYYLHRRIIGRYRNIGQIKGKTVVVSEAEN